MAVKSIQENFASDSREFNDRLEPLDRKQIEARRNMDSIKRLEMAFQAYQFILDAVRVTEQQNHPDLSAEEFNWRIVQRLNKIAFQFFKMRESDRGFKIPFS